MAAVDQLVTAKFILDDTGFSGSIKGINAELRNARAAFQNANTELGAFGRDSEKLKGVQEALARQVELHAKKVELYKTNIEDTTRKMNDNIKERDRLKESLDKANKSYDEAVKLYGKESEEAKKAKAEVDRLNKEYDKKEKAVESNAKQIQNYETNMNRANAQMNRAQGELNKINDELGKAENKWIQAGEALEKHSEKLTKIGGGMEAAGKGILKVTAPLVGIGAASLKVSTDFESGMANVRALSGATGDDFEELKEKAKEMGAATSKSATESAEGLANLALAGWDTTQMVEGIEPVLRLAEAGNIDLGRASALVTDSMSAMGIEVQDLAGYLDIVAQSARSSNTDIDQMAEAYVKVGGTLRGLQVPLDESALALGLMANAGIKGAEAGTGLNAVLLNLTAPTGRAKQALEDLGYSAFDSEGNFKGLETVLFDVKEMTKDMDTEQRNLYLSMIGGQAHLKSLNALMNGLDDGYADLKGSIGEADGALMDMAETMQDSTKGDVVKLQSQLEGVGIQIGEILIPYAREFVGKVSELVDKFAQLDPRTKETIVKLSGLAVGLGGVLLVGGKLVSGIGGAIGVFGKLAGAIGTATTATTGIGAAAGVAGGAGGIGALVSGLGGAVVAAGPFLAAGAAVAGVGYAIHKGMSQEAIPAIDLFADTVSEGTQQAVEAYLELDEKASKSLLNLYANSTEVTEDMAKSMIGQYQQMNKEIKSGMDKHHDLLYSDMEAFFAESSALTEREEAEALAKLKADNDAKRAETDAHTKRIQEILEKASEEKRALTRAEQQEINEIQNEMKVNAIEALSETEIESKVILERLKEYSTRITAEQASEVIANAEEQRIKAVEAAEQQYQETVANIIRMRDETGVITADQADRLIADAQRQKDESIVAAGEMKKGVVNQIKEMNADIIKDIDTTDGSIKTRWDKLKDWFRNNPIVRHIKTMTSGGDIGANWAGTDYWRGGLTTLHERGYEVYDLPRGTRIYNHEASEDLVMRTAEAVAAKIADGATPQAGGGVNVTQHIYVPTPSPSEVARQTKRNLQTMALDF